ncbi:hypothetical protein CAEBREN_21787 [Caenorhabditis brenneri]|uniref:Uncharacterized protein n=1 Tax=Caenorhabditis brenneri TaxID=135651 RepID=G0P931_CAEBE|nr:hypothetical protein CAEBREN_21787 [Caenorhabditis brenneri]
MYYYVVNYQDRDIFLISNDCEFVKILIRFGWFWRLLVENFDAIRLVLEAFDGEYDIFKRKVMLTLSEIDENYFDTIRLVLVAFCGKYDIFKERMKPTPLEVDERCSAAHLVFLEVNSFIFSESLTTPEDDF